jgi:hypothetical protein
MLLVLLVETGLCVGEGSVAAEVEDFDFSNEKRPQRIGSNQGTTAFVIPGVALDGEFGLLRYRCIS